MAGVVCNTEIVHHGWVALSSFKEPQHQGDLKSRRHRVAPVAQGRVKMDFNPGEKLMKARHVHPQDVGECLMILFSQLL